LLPKVFPHHRLHRFHGSLPVLRRLLLVVRNPNLAADVEVDELSDRHARVDANRLPDGNLQRPRVAETDVAFPRCGVDVDTEPTDAALAFEERDVLVRFGVLLRDAEVELTRNENQSFFRDAKVNDLVVALRVEDFIAVHREPISEMYVVTVRAEEIPIERPDDDRAPLHLREDLLVGEDHREIGLYPNVIEFPASVIYENSGQAQSRDSSLL
jgi:hypothetical protein